jgi:ribonuclease P protein component
MREAHVPAEHPKTQQTPRFSPPDEHSSRSSDSEVPPPAGAHATLRLIEPVRDRATFAALARARPRRSGPVAVRRAHLGGDRVPQVAYAVGRATGSAVARNRARRRLRAAVRTAAPHLGAGDAYLVSAGPQVVTMRFADLQAALTALLAPRAGPR